MVNDRIDLTTISTYDLKKSTLSTPKGIGKRAIELSKTREIMERLMAEYIELVQSTKLRFNKATSEINHESNLIAELIKSAGQLNDRNIDEGTFGIMAMMLNASVLLNEELNKLKYNNNLKIDEFRKLKSRIETLELSHNSSFEKKDGCEVMKKDDQAE